MKAAKERTNPARVGIVNVGPTRADHLADVKVEGLCGEVLPIIFQEGPDFSS